MPTLLVVHHSPTPTTRALADFVLDAARAAAREADSMLPAGESIAVVEANALEPDVEQLRDTDGLILGTTANFGYISGALKHYFDSTFMEIGEDLRDVPMSWWIRGGFDVEGAARAMRSITTGFGWKPAAAPVEFTGPVEPHHEHLRVMAQAVVGQMMA